MITTKTFYVYKTNNKLDIEVHTFSYKDLDDRTKKLFFDAQDDIELAGLDTESYIASIVEDKDKRQELENFMAYMEDAEDHDEALAELGMDDMEIDYILSGETIIGYVLPDFNAPEITCVASFLPIPALSDILCGIPAKQLSPLPLLRNRKS